MKEKIKVELSKDEAIMIIHLLDFAIKPDDSNKIKIGGLKARIHDSILKNWKEKNNIYKKK